ncbi:Variant SH3 domain containing protein [Coccidioides posadasii C735 delta SOWgp]|uniref:Class E vacuolar protein-sorting machinery protein HSE1 n=1 Tax=Coccidioides posadasii (strain C735) TaxID=222929 RepID=C5PGY6_COCP7|nr:Variant SH3 domain containing protein [Coccidioides posadasii C735 delta SOWgp]EER23789.1 Variant SH3 domain containing protein [Coccidioides posadasii C735 delta SOWgp]|eukprot:XP_003065934.1 Variant SH3 domain containing protein [Coccidioides posadasii C735 delta SOWgp]
MFRAQQNAYDDIVAKATDENLTSENWEYILDVCDKVSADESGAKDAVASMIKRLAHRNANVQLYTFELANALSQNCGPKAHRELASKSFTDALLRLANDRNTHPQVKSKILEHMEQWTEMFSSNPDFGIMEHAYMKLKSQNPNIQPPSKPTKRQITELDRQKEEEELQMALALSIKEKQSETSKQQDGSSQHVVTTSAQAEAAPSQGIPSGTTAATVSRVRALYDFQPSEPGELQFRKGDIIAVLESVYKDWWKGSLRGQVGIFPLNYVEKLSDPTQEELQREAQMEAEVFAEIKNVEKLLALLSTSSPELNVQENEEITKLYHSTLAIRPKLIELIGKYSKKKDDFTQLNEKFIKARRDYEALLEASMTHPAQSHYNRPAQPSFAYPPSGTHPGYPHHAPPQQEPQRYYTPRPSQDPQSAPHNTPGYYGAEPSTLPYPPDSQSPDFRKHTTTGSMQLPQQQPSQPPQDAYSQGATTHYPPKTTYDHPQELGTSVYDSPQGNAPQAIQRSYHPAMQQELQQQQATGAEPTQRPYSPQENPPPQAPSSNPPYPIQTPQEPPQQSFAPPAPMHQPPPIPSVAPSQGAYGGGYQAYQPPTTQQHSPTSNPAAFYR